MKSGPNAPTYQLNPFEGVKQPHHGLIYAPDEPTLSLISSLPHGAINALMIIAAHYDNKKGRSCVDRIRFMELLRVDSATVSKLVTQLQQHRLVARCKAVNQYWLSPKVFRPFTLLLS